MKIKGFILMSRKEFVIEHFGQEGWNQVLSVLPESDQAIFKETLLTSHWYEFETGKRLDDAIVRVHGSGAKQVFEDIGAQSARRNLGGIHSAFIEEKDPQAFMKKTSMIYKFYYDTGRREYEEKAPGHGIMTTYDAETFSGPDCLTVIGWYKEALKMCGARNVSMKEETCRARGGEHCKYVVKWEI